MFDFLNDLLRGGDSDNVAENPWSDGRGPSIETPNGDADNLLENPWSGVKSDSWLK